MKRARVLAFQEDAGCNLEHPASISGLMAEKITGINLIKGVARA
jgi:hypothetical protein